LLRQAVDAGADYVDVEARAGFEDLLAPTRRTRVVLSMHDFSGVPGDLPARVQSMRASGADVIKVAVTVGRLVDCVRLLDLAAASDDAGQRGTVLIGMGAYGAVTRILPSRFGSCWTYAGELEDLGQLTARTLAGEFRFRELGGGTALYGI